MPTLTTDRLLLRPFEERDLDAYAAMMADPEVVRYFLAGALTREAAWRQMAVFLGHERLRGWSNNAVVETATGRVVGRCGLWQPEGWPGLEVGWALARAFWSRGYASEAASAWRDWAFAELGARELISIIRPDNGRSIRVADRIGFGPLRDAEVDGVACVIYGRTR